MEERCYFCGRTKEECIAVIDRIIKKNMSLFKKMNKDVIEDRKKNEKIVQSAEAVRSSPQVKAQYSILNAPKEFMDKYGGWTKEDYQTAQRLGYPFEENSQIYFGAFSSIGPKKTLAEARDLLEDELKTYNEEVAKAKKAIGRESIEDEIRYIIYGEYFGEGIITEVPFRDPVRDESVFTVPSCVICEGRLRVLSEDIERECY